ncbi:hypothetical protein SEA_MACGULLY_93 [Rhodococcus phage MacGully]|nr:hypothetical protein SEA_MACGULLY_93 [Rhodococcus phage MacGully]
MSIIQCVGEHFGSERVASEVAYWVAYGEPIADGAALSIASWWQSPAGPGHAFAALASGAQIDIADVREAINAQLAELDSDGVDEDTDTPSAVGGWTADELQELRALGAWLTAFAAGDTDTDN